MSVGQSSRIGVQDYATVSALQSATSPVPKDNDKVFIASLNAFFDYISTSTDVHNGTTVIEQTGFAGRWHRIELLSWFDFIVANTSNNETETPETITIDGVQLNGVSSEIIFRGTTYKRFDLSDESQSYILSVTNQIMVKQY